MEHDPCDKTMVGETADVEAPVLRGSHASLVVLQGTEIGRDFRLRRGTMLVGRDDAADIRLMDDLASRTHAQVEFSYDPETRASTFSLVDLQSTNHTYVNSRRVERVTLQDGDRIQIGNTVLKFVILDDVEARFHPGIRSRISFDHLTGLLTRESLLIALEDQLKRCARFELDLAILMMDLDHFKTVNETHGHLMGSHVLSEVGRLICETIRGADVAARYGDEAFLTYLTEATDLGSHQVAERIRSAIESQVFSLDGRTVRVTISIGIAMFGEHGVDLKTLVAAAVKALDEAREKGGNRICRAPRRTSAKIEGVQAAARKRCAGGEPQ